METLNSINLDLAERLKDSEFRREWFRAELETTVPDLFRALREHRNLTQAELAEKAEMKQSAISRFEISANAKWKLETLLRLAESLDAQLSITLEPAEQVISRHVAEEKFREAPARSILDANAEVPKSPNRTTLLQNVVGARFLTPSQTARPNAVRSKMSLRGDNHWN